MLGIAARSSNQAESLEPSRCNSSDHMSDSCGCDTGGSLYTPLHAAVATICEIATSQEDPKFRHDGAHAMCGAGEGPSSDRSCCCGKEDHSLGKAWCSIFAVDGGDHSSAHFGGLAVWVSGTGTVSSSRRHSRCLGRESVAGIDNADSCIGSSHYSCESARPNQGGSARVLAAPPFTSTGREQNCWLQTRRRDACQLKFVLLLLLGAMFQTTGGITCEEEVLARSNFSSLTSLSQMHPARVILKNFAVGKCLHDAQKEDILETFSASLATVGLLGGEANTELPREDNATCTNLGDEHADCTQRYSTEIFHSLADDPSVPNKTYNGNPELPTALNTRCASLVDTKVDST